MDHTDMYSVEIKNETFVAILAFVAFFVVADMLSTMLIACRYGEGVFENEVNVFVHLSGASGLAAVKLGILIFAVGSIFVFSRYQVPIDDVLVGVAAGGAICSISNAFFLFYGYAPTIGHVGAVFLSGVVISVSVMKALIDYWLIRIMPGINDR
jgi:hypothetical protein